MLMTIMLPFHVVVVPQYILFNQLGWVNTFMPLILPKFLATDAFFVFLMVQFIRAFPGSWTRRLGSTVAATGRSSAGHASADGPAIATTAIFTFIWTWSDFFSPLIYLTDPLCLHGPRRAASRSWTRRLAATGVPMFAMSVVTLIPLFLVFLFGQRFLVKGIATTGGK